MSSEKLKGMEGWLLVYVIWTGALIIIALAYNIYNLAVDWQAEGLLRWLSLFSFCVFVCWYLAYAWILKNFIMRKPNCVKPVLFMLIATPILNLLMPGICGALAAAFIPNVAIGDMLAEIYYNDNLTSGAISLIIAACWLVYFRKSLRVKNTFAEVDDSVK